MIANAATLERQMSDVELDGVAGGFQFWGLEITYERKCTLDNNDKGQLVQTCTTTVTIDPAPKPK